MYVLDRAYPPSQLTAAELDIIRSEQVKDHKAVWSVAVMLDAIARCDLLLAHIAWLDVQSGVADG